MQFKAKDGRESRRSQTTIFVVFPVWEFEEEEREKKTIKDEKEEFQFRKFLNMYKTRGANFEGRSIIGSHADDPTSRIGTASMRGMHFARLRIKQRDAAPLNNGTCFVSHYKNSGFCVFFRRF